MDKKNNIQDIIDTIKPLQQQCHQHPLYKQLTTTNRIIHFMTHHVYCVWDFMNLLKTLQQQLTCTTIPWYPVKNAHTARLINEIVLEEESDLIDNKPTSHFAFYIKALSTLNPNNNALTTFLKELNTQKNYKSIITQTDIPNSVQDFLLFTYNSIQTSLLHTAATFTFGREALVPDLFEPIISNPTIKNHPNLSTFVTYLDRHIELDGEHHSHLAYEMINELCNTLQDWSTVKEHAIATLKARLTLWDAILATLPDA